MDFYSELPELYSFDCTTLNMIVKRELKEIDHSNSDLYIIAEKIHKQLPQFEVNFIYNLILSLN